jgi:hypothetical protein
MAQPVRVDAFDAGVLGASAQGVVESFVAHRAAAGAEPQVRRRRQRVLGAQEQVGTDRAVRDGADSDDPASAALAAADRDQAGVEVDVAEPECRDIARADRGFEHQAARPSES